MDQKFIISLQGKEFIKFEWLLNEFHTNWWKSIKTEIISTTPLIVQATAEGEKGTYQWIGDADEKNVNSMIIKHKIRMAETRAIARALRWYCNIWMCSADEMWGDDKPATNADYNKLEKDLSKPGEPVQMCEKCNIPKVKSQKGSWYCKNFCWK